MATLIWSALHCYKHAIDMILPGQEMFQVKWFWSWLLLMRGLELLLVVAQTGAITCPED